ncbi:hypothetical protein [Thalassomonas actiniarum]|uniref:Uncharacterized protein n=1 Tax=Thalassomonas actiniarum TaxID=485447 RepID=A0AAE9YY54_9GAMM|nr:hypothetical protein [Thalassomonas actiniarum]WDE02514.1 hypothetical protein SG35_029340 [Thalassomonas actiniarum]
MDVISRQSLNTPPSPIANKNAGIQGTQTVEVAQINYGGKEVKAQKISAELFKAMGQGEKANMFSRAIVPLVGNRTDDIVKSGGFSVRLSDMAGVEAKEASVNKDYGITSLKSSEAQALGSLRTGGGTCGNLSSLVFLTRAAQGHELPLQRIGWSHPTDGNVNHAFTVEGPDKNGMCAVYDSYGSEPSVHLLPYSTLVKTLDDDENYEVLDKRAPNPNGDAQIRDMLKNEIVKGLYSGAQYKDAFPVLPGGYESHCMRIVSVSGHMYDVPHFKEADAPVFYINESTNEKSSFSTMSKPLYDLLHTDTAQTDFAEEIEEMANVKHDGDTLAYNMSQLAQHIEDHELMDEHDAIDDQQMQPQLVREDSKLSTGSIDSFRSDDSDGEWGPMSFADFRHLANDIINKGNKEALTQMLQFANITDNDDLTVTQQGLKAELLTNIRTMLGDQSVNILTENP